MAKKANSISKAKKTPSKLFLKFLKDTAKSDSNGLANAIIDELEGFGDYSDTDNIFDLYDYYISKQTDQAKNRDMMLAITFYNRFYGEDIANMYHIKAFNRERTKYKAETKIKAKVAKAKEAKNKGVK